RFPYSSRPCVYALSLHDALPIFDLAIGAALVGDEPADVDAGDLGADDRRQFVDGDGLVGRGIASLMLVARPLLACERAHDVSPSDRKSTRLNSSHQIISYAVFCF